MIVNLSPVDKSVHTLSEGQNTVYLIIEQGKKRYETWQAIEMQPPLLELLERRLLIDFFLDEYIPTLEKVPQFFTFWGNENRHNPSGIGVF